jgi:tryptophan synthase alpha chain
MDRIKNCFAQLKQQRKTALIPFITAGDPSREISLDLMFSLVNAGADIIELGVAFSDPMADGPIIQQASERALATGINLVQVIDIVKQFRQQNQHTPIVLMGYLNPIEILGYEKFAQLASEAGVDGVLIVDLPPEEAESSLKILQTYNLNMIFLIAPTSNDERIKKIAKYASGYLYYVSLKGVTGSADLDVTQVENKLAQIRNYTDLPLGVGFGIKDAPTAAKIAPISDAVIVGSALVKLIATTQADQLLPVVEQFINGLRQAMDQNSG